MSKKVFIDWKMGSVLRCPNKCTELKPYRIEINTEEVDTSEIHTKYKISTDSISKSAKP